MKGYLQLLAAMLVIIAIMGMGAFVGYDISCKQRDRQEIAEQIAQQAKEVRAAIAREEQHVAELSKIVEIAHEIVAQRDQMIAERNKVVGEYNSLVADYEKLYALVLSYQQRR